jgi:hypothetical protein
VPVLDVNVCPSCADPEIAGIDIADGATTLGAGAGAGAAAGAAATTADTADTADADPFLFVAVTTTRIVAPTSPEANRYD